MAPAAFWNDALKGRPPPPEPPWLSRMSFLGSFWACKRGVPAQTGGCLWDLGPSWGSGLWGGAGLEEGLGLPEQHHGEVWEPQGPAAPLWRAQPGGSGGSGGSGGPGVPGYLHPAVRPQDLAPLWTVLSLRVRASTAWTPVPCRVQDRHCSAHCCWRQRVTKQD